MGEELAAVRDVGGRRALRLAAGGRNALAKSRAAAVAALVVGLLVLGAFIALWPGFALVAAALGAVATLAFVRPVYALVVAIALFGFEGSVKMLLADGGSPLPIAWETLAPTALDVALVLAGVGVAAGMTGKREIVRPRPFVVVAMALGVWFVASVAQAIAGGDVADAALYVALLCGALAFVAVRYAKRPLGELWLRLGRGRVAAALLAAAVAAALIQAFAVGDAARGVAGFRVTYAYVLVAVVAAFFPAERLAFTFQRLLLLCLGAVAGYAALRTVFGPLDVERSFIVTRGQPVITDPWWNAGSFSGPVALASFLVPTAVFASVLAIAEARLRRLGLAVALLALVGLAGARVTASALGLGAGLVVAAIPLLQSRVARPRRGRAVAVAAAVAILAFVAATAAVASGAPELRERAASRLEMWGDSLAAVPEHPLGVGLGSAGVPTRPLEPNVTLDSTYIKALYEQGLPGVLLVAGILGAVVTVLAWLVRSGRAASPLAVAAIAAFSAFAALAALGPYFDQPGKVVAWALLGLATSEMLKLAPKGGR